MNTYAMKNLRALRDQRRTGDGPVRPSRRYTWACAQIAHILSEFSPAVRYKLLRCAARSESKRERATAAYERDRRRAFGVTARAASTAAAKESACAQHERE
jgi:hypothetical protein